MFTIKKAAEITGVPAHTLRAWERRHGLFAPGRSPSGYRVYDDETIARIRAMGALVQAGWAPRDASAEVLRRRGVAASGWDAASDPTDDLIEAAAVLDADRVARVLDAQFARGDFETVLLGWLMPALAAVGRAWASGRITVAGEHLVANAVSRRLSAAYEAAGRGKGRPVVIGAPPGEHHELGLLAFAVAARRAGLATLYLGGDVPFEAWSDAVGATSARAVVTSASRSRDAALVAQVADRLAAERPGLPVWVGGRYQHLVPAPSRPLGHDIGLAAALLAADKGE
jgi:MerR family transcriptional regulator, light-induced transcriptional regulator